MKPTISIILPTFNRARFLPQAIESIREQQFTDWELIVVDDGSTDESPQLICQLTADFSNRVQYIRQDNRGPYAARNTGLDHIRGEYVAFFDSDDIWLPHHLQDCADVLNGNPDVDWVYGACRIIASGTGQVKAESTFYPDGKGRPFLNLKVRCSDKARIFDDPSFLECMIRNGLFCGLQNSLIRATVFSEKRFQVAFRHEGEDRVFALRLAAEGCRFAYIDNVHVLYNVHSENSSAPGGTVDLQKRYEIFSALVDARTDLLRQLKLTRQEEKALRYRISREIFWELGYATLWQQGRHWDAIRSFLRAIVVYPWVVSYWKTLFGCSLRAVFHSSASLR